MSRIPTLTERLADLQSWRYGLSAEVQRVRDFLVTHEFLQPNTDAALQAAQQEISQQRVTIALVAEAARGKSELINALFFSDLGRPFLPSGPGKSTRCVTELRFDRNQKTAVRLLPVETRESPMRFEDLLADESQWRVVPFDADNPESMSRALAALGETKRISLVDAVAWGLHREGIAIPADETSTTLVDVPRWRFAVVNFPHPYLDAGLVIIDTPGLAAFTSEPELARERVPGADALLVMLDVNEGANKADIAIWRDHLGGSAGPASRVRPAEESGQARFVVLNKIDLLSVPEDVEPAEAAKAQLREIDKRVHETAELFRLDPIHVIAVSAKMALSGKLAGDKDKSIRSRLYQLERGIAAGLSNQKQVKLREATLNTLTTALEAAQASLDNERYETLEALRKLSKLREKNEKLGTAAAHQAAAQQDRLDDIINEFRSIRTVHNRFAEDIAALVDVSLAKREAARARAALLASKLPGTITETIQQYFSLNRAKLHSLETKINEVRSLYSNIIDRMQRDFSMGIADAHPFPTQRFYTELDKTQSASDTDLTRSSNLLVRRGPTLSDQFDTLVAARVVHIFEIASRESVTWLKGLYVGVEKPLELLKRQTTDKVDGVSKLMSAELDLAERIAEVQARVDVVKRKHTALAEAREKLERFANSAHEAEETLDA